MTESVRTRAAIAVAVLALVLGLSACGSSGDDTTDTAGSGATITSNPANGKVNLTIGSKNFTEQIVLGEIYSQALEAAGYKVKKDLNLGFRDGGAAGAARPARSPAIPSTRARR